MTSSVFDNSTPLRTKDQLIAHLEAGCTQTPRMGIEDEKLIVHGETFQRLGFEGQDSIPALLQELARHREAWTPVLEEGQYVGLTESQPLLGNISQEPGGQLEFASHPRDTLQQLWHDYQTYLQLLKHIMEQKGWVALSTGVDPLTPLEQAPRVSKRRYDIMRAYMPHKGDLGLWMMHQTCTTQVSLDFESERDMAQKMRLATQLQPFITALFANSPLREGKVNGYASYRAHIWTRTDPDRCGHLTFALEPGMGFERYVDYALEVPLYFLYRDGGYQPVERGITFRQLMEDPTKAPFAGELILADWEMHLTTLFPEVRLKNIIELRGADTCRPEWVPALVAFWIGALYHAPTTEALIQLLKSWKGEVFVELAADVPRQGMLASVQGQSLFHWAQQILPLIYQGLVARNLGEEVFLEPLERLLEAKATPADLQTLIFQETGDLGPVLAYLAI